MRKIILFFVTLALALATEHTVNNAKSTIDFQITKMLFIDVEGTFEHFEGSIIVSHDKLISVNGIIATNSIKTDSDDRDNSLKDEGFFNTTEHASILFRSTKIEDTKLHAEVTIKGVTQSLVFKIVSFSTNPTGTRLELSSDVNRQDFGLAGMMSFAINDIAHVTTMLVAE